MYTTAEFVIALFLRILLSGSVYWVHPFAAFVLAHIGESMDFFAWRMDAGHPRRIVYEHWDKIGDIIYLLLGCAFMWRMRKNLWYAPYLVPVGVARIVGILAFFLMRDRTFFIIVPDIYTYWYILFAVADVFTFDRKLNLRKRPMMLWPMLLCTAAFKTLEEYIHHRIVDFNYFRTALTSTEPGYTPLFDFVVHRVMWMIPIIVLVLHYGFVLQPNFDHRTERGRFWMYEPQPSLGLKTPAPSAPVAAPVFVQGTHPEDET